MGAAVPIISLVATAGSAIMGAVGAEQQAKAQAAAASYNAQVARNAATYETEQGQVQAEAQQRQRAALTGRQRAMFGAMGVDVNTGSPLDIQSDTYTFGKLNEATALSNANRAAWGYSTQAGLYDTEAANARSAGNVNAFGALIGGAGALSNRWTEYQQSGVFSNDPLNPGSSWTIANGGGAGGF